MLYDGVLATAGSYAYGAYGERVAVPSPGVRYEYTGQEYDGESALMNYRARLYDPLLGRFLAVDPAGQFASPYLYVGNNPVMGVDPDGEIAWFIVAAAVVGGVTRGLQAYHESGGGWVYTMANAVLGAGQAGVQAQAAATLPTLNLGGGFSIAPTFSIGSHNNSVGLQVGGAWGHSFKFASVAAGVQAGFAYNLDDGAEGRLGWGGGAAHGRDYVALSGTFFFSGKTTQQTGRLALGTDGWLQFDFENDAQYFGLKDSFGIFGDGGDRYTAKRALFDGDAGRKTPHTTPWGRCGAAAPVNPEAACCRTAAGGFLIANTYELVLRQVVVDG